MINKEKLRKICKECGTDIKKWEIRCEIERLLERTLSELTVEEYRFLKENGEL